MVGSLYMGAGLRAGEHLWILPRVWWHGLPDDEGLAEHTPFGAGLALRVGMGG